MSTILVISAIGVYLYIVYRLFTWVANSCKDAYVKRMRVALFARIDKNLSELLDYYSKQGQDIPMELDTLRRHLIPTFLPFSISVLNKWVEGEQDHHVESLLYLLLLDCNELKDLPNYDPINN
jgi:hypothetical protein